MSGTDEVKGAAIDASASESEIPAWAACSQLCKNTVKLVKKVIS